jgi:hypothetical protein
MARDTRSLLDNLVGACLSLLVGATAVYVAVRLIEAVSGALSIIVFVGLFVLTALALFRARSGTW